MNEEYMNEALDLALNGIGFVNPNPLVGALIVKNSKVIGKGWHKFYGGPHAEIYALEEAGEEANGATMYITLEPCSHYGKTPPCVNKIIETGIKKCIVATLDPNPKVSGRGIKILEEAGIEVVLGVCEEKAKDLNKVFFKFIKEKEAYLFLKCGITIDGKIATKFGDSKWITNELAREKVQCLRSKFMGIMVGINTILNDNPMLNSRIENGRNPYRFVIDPHLKTPIDCNFSNFDDNKSYIVTSLENIKFDSEVHSKFNLLKNKNINFIFLEGDKFSIKEILLKIGELNIDSVLLEGGAYLISQAFSENTIDGGEIFIAPKILGGGLPFINGFNFETISSSIKLENVKTNIYGDNISFEFYNNL